MAAKEKTLNDLFLHTLKDIFYAEKQILKALPKMAKNAESEELRQAFETHREETEGQIERLEKVFEMLGKPARGVQCEAINGIIEEGKEVMEDFAESAALDAGILAAAQAVEHYEITRYGSLKTWAEELGLSDAAKLLDQTLQEEKKTDQLLTKLAEARARQNSIASRMESAMTRARTSELLHGSRTEEAFAKFELLERRADFAEGRADALALTGPKSLEEEIAELRATEAVDAELEAMKAALAARN